MTEEDCIELDLKVVWLQALSNYVLPTRFSTKF